MNATAAKNALRLACSSMPDRAIQDLLLALEKPWDAYLPEERTVRVYLLAEFEKRQGIDAVDALMTRLEGSVAD